MHLRIWSRLVIECLKFCIYLFFDHRTSLKTFENSAKKITVIIVSDPILQ